MKNLDAIFKKYGKNLTKNQIFMFETYFSMLIEKNKVLNLTSITEEDEVVVKHFLDSVLPEAELRVGSSVVDVGTGAGFPAIPLKIVRPDLKMTLVDSLNKRVDFLKEVVNELKFTDITLTHARVEDFAKINFEKYDHATARAVAPLNTLTEYLLPLIKIGGSAVIYKSSKLEEELKVAEKAINLLGGEVSKVLSFELEGMERNILIIEKVKHTSKGYPRGKNLPKTKPIV